MNAQVRYHLDDGNDRALGRVIRRSFRRLIDAIHGWLPINFSFVLVQISLPGLVAMCSTEKNSCSKVRLGRLICTIVEHK